MDYSTTPVDVLVEVFSYLKPEDLFPLTRVCKTWKFAVEDNRCWSRYFSSRVCSEILSTTPSISLKDLYSSWIKQQVEDYNEGVHLAWGDMIKLFPPKKGHHKRSHDLKADDFAFNFWFIGPTGVGTTSLVRRYSGDALGGALRVVIGDTRVRLQLVDIQLLGQDPTRQKNHPSRGLDCLFIVYDITNRASFDSLKIWLPLLNTLNMDQWFMVLVGNKTDLVKINRDARAVSREEAMELAEQENIPFIETSAKTGNNVTELIHMMTRIVLKKRERWYPKRSIRNKEVPEQIDSPSNERTSSTQNQNNNNNNNSNVDVDSLFKFPPRPSTLISREFFLRVINIWERMEERNRPKTGDSKLSNSDAFAVHCLIQ